VNDAHRLRAPNRPRELTLSPAQLAIELARPWVLLALYVVVAASGHVLWSIPIAVAVAFATFVQMHDATHESLGLSKRGHAIVLVLAAQLLLKSGHAIKATHLRHHGKCLGDADPEGAPARWSLRRVLFAGPFHALALRLSALQIAPRTARAQILETLGSAVVVGLAIGAYVVFRSPVGLVYWAVAAAVSATMPLWAAYIPHRLASRSPPVRAAAKLARVWTPVVNSFAYHHVHHAHPKVPTALLPYIARASEVEDCAHDHAHESGG